MENAIFEEKKVSKAYMKLSLPLVLSMTVSLIYNLADTFFVAQTQNTNIVAGVSLCAPLFTTLMALGNIFGQGGSSLISRLLGKNDTTATRRVSAFCFWGAILIGVLMGFIMLLFRTPLLYVIGITFLEKDDVWGITNVFTLENYKNLFSAVYGKVFLDSFLVAIATTVLTLLIGYPFAYFTAKFPPRVRSFIVLLLMTPFWINSLLRLNGWIILLKANGVVNTALQAVGIIDEPLKILYNNGAMMLGMVYALLPFMITSIYNSVEKLDWTVVEASRDLGASPFKAFLTVTVPLTVPGIVAGCVLVFVPSMGLFFISDLLGGSKTLLLGNLIKNEFMQARNWPMGATLSIAMLVFTTVFIYIYKRVTGAKTLGGLR